MCRSVISLFCPTAGPCWKYDENSVFTTAPLGRGRAGDRVTSNGNTGDTREITKALHWREVRLVLLRKWPVWGQS